MNIKTNFTLFSIFFLFCGTLGSHFYCYSVEQTNWNFYSANKKSQNAKHELICHQKCSLLRDKKVQPLYWLKYLEDFYHHKIWLFSAPLKLQSFSLYNLQRQLLWFINRGEKLKLHLGKLMMVFNWVCWELFQPCLKWTWVYCQKGVSVWCEYRQVHKLSKQSWWQYVSSQPQSRACH